LAESLMFLARRLSNICLL